MQSLGVESEPISFYPERNEYELRIELPDCPKEMIKVTYERPSGKLKVQGRKHKKGDFVQEFSVPADCIVKEIHGRFRGDVLHIIMPRSKTDMPSFSKQEDERVSYGRKTAEKAREKEEQDQQDRKLPAQVPAPPPSDRKTADKAREKVEKDQEPPASVPAPPPSDRKTAEKAREEVEKDRDLPAKIPAPPLSDRKTTEEVREQVERDKTLPARVTTPPLSDQKTREVVRERVENDRELPAEVPAPPQSDWKTTDNVREKIEKYQKLLAEITATPPSDQKTTYEVRERLEKDKKLPAEVPAPPLSDQKTADQKDIEANFKAHEKLTKQDHNTPDKAEEREEKGGENLKRDESNSKPAKVDRSPKTERPAPEVADNLNTEPETEENEKEKPSASNEKRVWATVKETGKAALAVAMKEENRRLLVIGATALIVAVIGVASFRSSRRVKN